MKTVLFGTTIALALLSNGAAWAQADSVKKQIVGVWRLVHDTNDGKKGVAFGANPKGELIFTANGHYASVNSRGDLPTFTSGNRMKGTAEENKAIVQGSIAHFGTYTITPDGKAFVLKVEGGTWPAWVGKEQKRDVTIKGDELKYSVVASIGGSSELVFKRVK
jgi:hypothetical protein